MQIPSQVTPIRFKGRKPADRPMLFLDDVTELTKTNQLRSGHINAAQLILKLHHPDIGGLFCCTMGSLLQFPQAEGDKWMQIVHNGSNHWLLVAKGFSQPDHVLIYDSMPGISWNNEHVLSCMSSLLKSPEKEMTYVVKNCQRQNNGYDCGVFAIAYATSLANGEDPATRLYDPKKLRNHLVECMKAGKLSLFPSSLGRSKRSREVVEGVELHCVCRRTGYELPSDEWRFVGCDGEDCDYWRHRMCVEDYSGNDGDEWLCSNCKK